MFCPVGTHHRYHLGNVLTALVVVQHLPRQVVQQKILNVLQSTLPLLDMKGCLLLL